MSLTNKQKQDAAKALMKTTVFAPTYLEAVESLIKELAKVGLIIMPVTHTSRKLNERTAIEKEEK